MTRLRWWPDSIGARVAVVLMLGLTLSHVASMAAYRIDLLAQLGLSTERDLVERVGTISRLIADTPEPSRDATAHALSSASLEIHWSGRRLVNRSAGADPRLAALSQQLKNTLKDETAQILLSYADEGFAPLTGEGVEPHEMLVSVQLPDRSWVNFGVTVPASRRLDTSDILISTTLMAIAIILVSMMGVRLLTAPLRALAGAATRLGVDVSTPPLAERGPREVRAAARAFNGMQARIKKLLADRTQMLAAISHDLRTPITRLSLRAELVEDDLLRRDMLADLGEMEAMIASVLAFLRQDAAHEPMKVVDLTAILDTICNDMADAGHNVRFDGSGHTPLSCRPLAMKRALINLVDNAVKYGGGVRVSLAVANDQVSIDIDDDGPGIPEAEREKVFTPFYRLETSRSRTTGGTGLGLTVARSILQAHGGDVTLSDRSGGGLRAAVRLPRIPDGKAHNPSVGSNG